jgi:uncharacterized membrane protein
MQNRKKRSSIMMTLLMLSSIVAAMGVAVPVQASEIVLTDAINVVNSGSNSDSMVAVDSDSEGNVHFVWSRNTQHLYYKMLGPSGETLISETQISNPGAHQAWHPDVAIDSEDKLHIVWADRSGQWTIWYQLLDPAMHEQDGSNAIDGLNGISLIDDYEVRTGSQDRDWPAVAVDSLNNAHIVWQDNNDPLDLYYSQTQIYYEMIEIDVSSREAQSKIDATLLTPIIGMKGHPDIAVDNDDFVQVVWDDTRGGKVEMVVPIDTSGSMGTEWADMCTVFYGGQFSSGGNFIGLKPMLEQANMTVFETLYGIGGVQQVAAATSGYCTTAYQTGGSGSQGPRSNHLGQNPSDTSGGIRKLTGAVLNNAAISLSYDGGGQGSEAWGPSSTWSCLSWRDTQGRLGNLANPPTTEDHRWNPNATKIIIPISDESANDGTPEDATDRESVNEAHDACVLAGISPVPLWAGADGNVGSQMRDLAECPNNQPGTPSVARYCPGGTPRTTHAEGAVYAFPTGSSSAAELQFMVEALIYLATNASREIFISVLDPYALLDNPWVGFAPGQPATRCVPQCSATSGSRYYIEDVGPSLDLQGYGHLVVVNDTRVTLQDAYSLHPQIALDSQGNTHIAWMDGRSYGFELDVNYEVFYTRLKLKGAGQWDGASDGLPAFGIKQIMDSAISNVEGLDWFDDNPDRGPYEATSYLPGILVDDFDNIHIAWLDNSNQSQGESIMYTRLNSTTDRYPDGFPTLNNLAIAVLDEWEIFEVSTWESGKLGPNSPRNPQLGTPPAFSNDLGSGAHVAWSDSTKCGEANSPKQTLCYVHVLTGLVDVALAPSETYYHVIEPGESTIYNLTIDNPTPGPSDLVADTFRLTVEDVPMNWSATLYYASNHTPIFESTPIHLKGNSNGENLVPLYLRVRAPTIYQAEGDQLAEIKVRAVSYKDPAIDDERQLVILMDVVHGIDLSTINKNIDVEQGGSGTFSIIIRNTGNVYDTFAFHDPSTLDGQMEWGLQFGWGVDFPMEVSLDPGQAVTKNLRVTIPTSQTPGTYVIYLKGWSTGEPIFQIDHGTYDVLGLWINVSVKTSGNIVFKIPDGTNLNVLPGDCAEFDIEVTKNYSPGSLVFTTPGGPSERPSDISQSVWRYDHWTVDLDFSSAPGGNGIPENAPRYWAVVGNPYVVTANMCSPYNATAGFGESVVVKAHLEGTPEVRDSALLLTNVIQVYELEAEVDSNILELYPGQAYPLTTEITNTGNGPDRFDITVESVTGPEGAYIWDIDIPRAYFGELLRDDSKEFDLIINVPEKTLAGTYSIVLNVLSEEPYEGTRVRESIELQVEITEFHDLRITLDPAMESKIKTSAPGRTVRFLMNLTNAGNVPDTPMLHNHTRLPGAAGWDATPGMNTLSKWMITYALVEDFDTEYPREAPCLPPEPSIAPESDACYTSTTSTVTFPEMDAFTTIQFVAIISIDDQAQLSDRSIGIKATSIHGSAANDGDFDETPEWDDSCTLDENKDGLPDNFPPACDSNEQVLQLMLRAPDLKILSADAPQSRAGVGEMISVTVKLQNIGNIHATDVSVILCADQSPSDIRKNGCDEDNIVYRQLIEAVMPVSQSSNQELLEISLLYIVEAGSQDVVVYVDPDNNIIESDESNNYWSLSDKMGSNNRFLDPLLEAVATYSVPVIIIGATIALGGVAVVVIWGRRIEAMKEYAEKKSMMVYTDDDMEF